MTLRSIALRLCLAGALVPGLAAAQSLRSAAPAAFPDDQAVSNTAAPAGSASALAACTVEQPLNQAAAPTNVYGNVAGAQELGQSFVAPCDGNLNVVSLIIQNVGNPGNVARGTLRVYNGAGTTGTLLDSRPFRIANPNTGTTTPPVFGATTYPLFVNAPVVTGQTYTFFVDMASDSTGIQGTSSGTAGPYANGSLYFSSTGNPAVTSPVATIDLYFLLTFNAAPITQASTFNGPGWRLLAPPVAPFPVQYLSDENLVQGYLSQYPTAAPNLLQTYVGGGAFDARSTITPTVTPAAATFSPSQGRGFFWYFYDQAISPDSTSFGGGTSDSQELTGFTLTATGRSVTANFLRTQPQYNADGFYMLGNPFKLPLAVSGITRTSAASTGTLGTSFFVYDPAIANYRTLFTSNPANGGASDYVAVWQGLFGQLSGATVTTAPQFQYAFASTSTTATPPFYGRGATTGSAPYVQLMLDGTTATGTEVHDVTAYVRFTPGGIATWDADDASKLALPPGVAYALLAPVGVSESGSRTRLAVNSFSDAATEAVVVPVDFTATEAGTFTVSWAGADVLPAGWAATLTDNVTGTVVNLRQTPDYTFTSDAADWTERFTLLVTPRGAVAGEAGPAALRVGTFAPNPAAGISRLTFTSDIAQTVRATVVDALGREVVVLFDAAVTAGAETTVAVEAGRLAPGTYAVRIAGETFSETRRLTVVR